jgi:hypothetical protein
VISRCANPACSTHFRYLHEGQIFGFEVRSIPAAGVDVPGMNSLSRRTEYFWLCDSCALNMKLVFEPGAGVTLVSVHRDVRNVVLAPGRKRYLGDEDSISRIMMRKDCGDGRGAR